MRAGQRPVDGVMVKGVRGGEERGAGYVISPVRNANVTKELY